MKYSKNRFLFSARPSTLGSVNITKRENVMRKLLLATTAVALSAGAVSAEDIKIGVILGFTGPIESLTPQMGAAAEMAMAEVNASGRTPRRVNLDLCARRLHLY
jgi:ABC-type branched-subunit amino acid transport system substrate-binding protein